MENILKIMMTNDDYQHFVCIVAGDNPENLLAKYDKNKETEPRLVYEYEKAHKLKDMYIDMYSVSLGEELTQAQRDYVFEMIHDLAEMSDDDFFNDLVETEGLTIGEDGNAYTTKNKDGKWSSCSMGKLYSIPFYTKDGREVFQAKKSEIDWEHTHLSGGEIYEKAWEMVMEGQLPTNDYEQTIYDNMKDKRYYFEKFGNKHNYVVSNTAFWGYAFLSEETGWMDASNVEDQFAWMSSFYDVFISKLDDDTLLTIYECRK